MTPFARAGGLISTDFSCPNDVCRPPITTTLNTYRGCSVVTGDLLIDLVRPGPGVPTTLGDTFEALVVVMGTLQIRAWRSLADLGTSFSNLELIHGALIINEMGGLRTLGIAFSKLVGVGFDRGPSDYEAESRSQYAQYGLGLVISECENLRSFGTAFSMLKYIHDGLHLANNRHLVDPIGNSGPAFRQLVSGAGLYYYHLMGLPPHTHTHTPPPPPPPQEA